ncbi:MAG: hypothetical protein DRJ98_08735 [Thermoprotei archaeon]|nr:MAG: hypothetical protein DRJ98_08735 [Thermoprotei archaeon]
MNEQLKLRYRPIRSLKTKLNSTGTIQSHILEEISPKVTNPQLNPRCLAEFISKYSQPFKLGYAAGIRTPSSRLFPCTARNVNKFLKALSFRAGLDAYRVLDGPQDG